jgi:4-hydroxy-3-polyprenylbenzoate decarboxylase
MMFTKYLVVVSGEVNIRNYRDLAIHVLDNTSFGNDILFTHGPLDVLDHSSDSFSFGGKAGIDATIKLPEESHGRQNNRKAILNAKAENSEAVFREPFVKASGISLIKHNIGILILSVNPSEDPFSIQKVCELLRKEAGKNTYRLVIAIDHTVDPDDIFMVAWQVLGNSDPARDHIKISPDKILIDGTIKYYRKGGFPRPWPNVVCSDANTIEKIDKEWNGFGFDDFIPSPSLKSIKLKRGEGDSISG